MLNTLTKNSLRLSTQRLRLDAWNPEDLPLLFALHSDPRIQSGYSEEADTWTEPFIKTKLARFIEEQETRGITKWKMSLHDGTFVGRAGWSPWEGKELEIGYAISPEHQNRGYAVEAASALLADARRTRRTEQLVGFALIGNIASRRVLERIGMIYSGQRLISGAQHAFYRASP